MSTAQMPPAGIDSGSDSQNIALHVLCPSLPQPNRITIKDLAPSTTVATLKARISQSVPSHPSPENQRLFYLGKPLLNNNATLQTVLGPLNASEFSIHLVLPPAPQVTSTSRSPTVDRAPLHQNPLFTSRFTSSYVPQSQELRYRGPAAPAPPNDEAEIGLALRQNVDALHRRLDRREQEFYRTQAQVSTTTAPANLPTSSTVPPSQAPWQHVTPRGSRPPLSPSTSYFPNLSSNLFNLSPGLRNPNFDSYPPGDARLRLQLLTQQVTSVEEQLSRGVAPPMDHIISIRTQVFDMLDDQYRRPANERDISIESLLTRVFNLYTRADQLRTVHARFLMLHRSSSHSATRLGETQAPLYLLTSPDGYQALVASPSGSATIQTSLDALRAGHPPLATFPVGGSQPPNAPPNVNPAVLQNVVRQVVLNQQAAENDQFGLARNIRRLWLFVRLYFFCHMLTTAGTWTRVIFVGLAVIASILSETSFPRHLYQILVAPIQRHLEGLVHFTPEEHTRPGPPGAEATVDRQGGLQGGLRHNLRRVERSLALFIASLVPGVGERHVQVRNEAVRNAERAREEEERLRQEAAAREQEQQQSSQHTTEPESITEPESTRQNTATENETLAAAPQQDNH